MRACGKHAGQILKWRGVKCHEETEQAQEVKALEQEGAWGEVALDAVCVAALLQALGAIAYVRAAVSELPTNSEPLAFSENAPSAGSL